jgi:hypothetical protein
VTYRICVLILNVMFRLDVEKTRSLA